MSNKTLASKINNRLYYVKTKDTPEVVELVDLPQGAGDHYHERQAMLLLKLLYTGVSGETFDAFSGLVGIDSNAVTDLCVNLFDH